MKGQSYQKKIILGLVTSGIFLVAIGIKICYDSDEIKKRQMIDKQSPRYHIEKDAVTAKYFGISQIFVSFGILEILVGVVAWRVYKDKIAELKKHNTKGVRRKSLTFKNNRQSFIV